MSWWAVPIVAVLGIVGFFAGWAAGTILAAFRDEPMNVWEDWEN